MFFLTSRWNVTVSFRDARGWKWIHFAGSREWESGRWNGHQFLSWDKVAGQCLPRSRSGRWRRGLASELRRAAFFGLYTLKDAVALYLLLSSSTVMRRVLQWQLNVFCSHNRTLILRRRIHLFKKDKDCAHWWMDFRITWMEDGPWTVINPIKFWSGSRMVFDTFQHGKLGY